MSHVTLSVVVSADNKTHDKVFHLDGDKVLAQVKKGRGEVDIGEALIAWLEKGIEGAHIAHAGDEPTNPAIEAPTKKRK